MLVGRENERKMLKEAYEADESKFVAIYGRRRIGKTYLVRETFENHFTFQHSGYFGGKLSDELFEFCISIRQYGLDGFEQPKNWLEAFELLKRVIMNSPDKRKVVFLDELSWMDTRGSDFVMALEGFWNGWASARKDVLLIVCGSVTSWMISKIVHNKGGLYNRLSFRINLEPFTLKECEEYVNAKNIIMNRYSILQCYMIMGGVPYYWSFLEKGLSLPQNIDRIFFADNALLDNEFEYIYSSLFHNPEPYIKIISALGKKKAGMTREEIVKASKLPESGNLSKKLEELENCGFIRRYNSYGKKQKDSLYQLIDNFTLFYFKFLEKKPTDEHFWTNNQLSQAVKTWCGLAFERVCLEHVSEIKNALGISGVSTNAYSWSCKKDNEKGLEGSQIDLIIERRDQIIDLCEMKYSTKPFKVTLKVDTDIHRKTWDFINATGTHFAVHPIILTPYGITDDSYRGQIQAVITADDLFK
jgi:AAA+ ATPase superfamily predicted ATPase